MWWRFLFHGHLLWSIHGGLEQSGTYRWLLWLRDSYYFFSLSPVGATWWHGWVGVCVMLVGLVSIMSSCIRRCCDGMDVLCVVGWERVCQGV